MITFVRVTSPNSPMYSPPPSRWRREARKLGVAAARVLVLLAAVEVALVFRAGGWA